MRPSDETMREKARANQKKTAALEKLVEEQARIIQRLRKPNKRQPNAIPTARSKTYTRVCIPDTHGSKCSKEALNALYGDLRKLSNIREVILLGDHIDCGGFLAQHHTLGYVDETGYSFCEDVAACNEFLDTIHGICPKARITYIEGNHEARIEKWIVTSVLRSEADANLLRSIFGPEHVLYLAKRGIEFIPQKSRNGNTRTRGAIKRGPCYFTHGASYRGKNAARSAMADFKRNVVFANTHRMLSYAESSAEDEQIGAWCPGCLSELMPLWRNTDYTHWSHGYAVQIVKCESEKFLHVNVPIIDGVSLLSSLVVG